MWRSKATRKCGNTANGSRSSAAKAAASPSRRSDCRRITHATAVSGTTETMTCCSAHSGVVSDTKRVSLCDKLTVKRGNIYYADLSGTIGSEQGGIRPVLVVQNDVGNFHSPTIIIAPISTAGKHYLPVHIRIGKSGGLSRNSTVFLEQIRTIDRQRIRHYVGTLDGKMMRKVDDAIKNSLGVNL